MPVRFGLRYARGSLLARWLNRNNLRLQGIVRVVQRHTLKARVLALAAKQIGVKEYPAGSNRQKFGEWFGVNGVAWCAIFVSWVLSHSGRPFKYAGVPLILEDARANKKGLSVVRWTRVRSALAAGHVVLACYDWPGESPGTPDHIGFVKRVLDGSMFEAIEGNTSPSTGGSQSNGGEVCLKQRHVSDVEAFIRVM